MPQNRRASRWSNGCTTRSSEARPRSGACPARSLPITDIADPASTRRTRLPALRCAPRPSISRWRIEGIEGSAFVRYGNSSRTISRSPQWSSRWTIASSQLANASVPGTPR
ncbi:hypothetical protein AB0C10_00595 [Microbispora amethystogenes]|uniref:hypothetical protein n=1 Tax=Microbispora amethystogenes TaxID=1427754 RepID=UPI00340F3AB0